jgi:hypothetical protein
MSITTPGRMALEKLFQAGGRMAWNSFSVREQEALVYLETDGQVERDGQAVVLVYQR